MAADLSVDLERWRQEFDELMLRLGGRFTRVVRDDLRGYVLEAFR